MWNVQPHLHFCIDLQVILRLYDSVLSKIPPGSILDAKNAQVSAR